MNTGRSTYQSSSRGNNRKTRGGNNYYYNEKNQENTPSQQKTYNKATTITTNNLSDAKKDVNKSINSLSEITSKSTNNVNSPKVKKVFNSKKPNINYDNLPDLNSSSAKNVDISVDESKNEIVNSSLVEENKLIINENNFNNNINISVEQFDINKNMEANNLVNKNNTDILQEINSASSRKESMNAEKEREIEESINKLSEQINKKMQSDGNLLFLRYHINS